MPPSRPLPALEPSERRAQLRGSRQGWLLAVIAAAVTALTIAGLKHRAVAFDLAEVYVPAAQSVLDGASPYPSLDSPVFEGHQAYVYPPLTAFLSMPLTQLGDDAVRYGGVLGALAILALALFVVGVRDPGVYAVFALWPPTMTAWQNANVSVLMVLALALTWRFRDSWPRAGISLGAGIALKLILWPLSLWLLATRRIRAGLASIAVGAFVLLGTWLAIGFKGLADYPDLLNRLTDVEAENEHSVSLYSDALVLGAPKGVATAASLALGLALLAGALALARRGEAERSFLLTIVAALALTPLVWLHYIAFLAVPLAVARPRLSGLWAVPLLFWAMALPGWPTEPRRLIALVVVGVLVGALGTRPRGSAARALAHVRKDRVAVEAGR